MSILGKDFPDSEIRVVNQRNLIYIIREPDGTVWYAKFRNIRDDSPIDKYILFKPLRKAPS